MSGTACRWTVGVSLWGWLGRGAKNVLGCSTTILLVVVVLLTPQEVAAPRTDSIIRSYFEKGFSYRLILYFLVAYHGIRMSLSTLKRRLRRLNLRRRGCHSSLYYTGQCALVIAIVFVMNYVLCTYKQRELNCSGSLLGYRAMHMRLRQRYGVITHLRS